MKFLTAATIATLLLPTASFAAIDLNNNSAHPLNLQETTVASFTENLPEGGEFLSDLAARTKNAANSTLGQKVIGVLKMIGTLFVWVAERMLDILKYLLNKF